LTCSREPPTWWAISDWLIRKSTTSTPAAAVLPDPPAGRNPVDQARRLLAVPADRCVHGYRPTHSGNAPTRGTIMKRTFRMVAAGVLITAIVVAGQTAESASPRVRALHVTKECSQYIAAAGSFCTITSLERQGHQGRCTYRRQLGSPLRWSCGPRSRRRRCDLSASASRSLDIYVRIPSGGSPSGTCCYELIWT
jgi:hypothetical protein